MFHEGHVASADLLWSALDFSDLRDLCCS